MTKEINQEAPDILPAQTYLQKVQEYMAWFGINLIVHSIGNWNSLPDSIESNRLSILAGLTHECISDGLYPRLIFEQLEQKHTKQYHGLVYAEGFEKDDHKPTARKKAAQNLCSTIPFHKHDPRKKELELAQHLAAKDSIVVFVQGTRDPAAPLNETYLPMIGRRQPLPADIFPFIALGLGTGIFPAKSGIWANRLAYLTKGGPLRLGKTRDVHFVSGIPILNEQITQLIKTKGSIAQTFPENEEGKISQTSKTALHDQLILERLRMLDFLLTQAPELKKIYPKLVDQLKLLDTIKTSLRSSS